MCEYEKVEEKEQIYAASRSQGNNQNSAFGIAQELEF
jgi:hypothetical protein